MEKSKKIKKRRKGASCLGVLLVFCMLILAGCTLGANLLFREDTALKLAGHMYYYNSADDLSSSVPQGSLVIVDAPDTAAAGDVVLYQSTAGTYKIAKVSLILSSNSTAEGIEAESVYYLTNDKSLAAIAVMRSDLVGICKQRSNELGMMVGFLVSKTGILVGLIAPCIILLLYIMALMAAAHETIVEDDDDDDTDLAFVKSIQEHKKLQQTGEFPKVTESDVPSPSTVASHTPAKQKRSPEELAAAEEKEAAERAERIAAIRSRMEKRQSTEMPDNVPLFTTEFIARTHTMQIPKNATATAAENATAKRAVEQAAKRAEEAKKAADAAAAEEQRKAEEERASAMVQSPPASKHSEPALEAEIVTPAQMEAAASKTATPRKRKQPPKKKVEATDFAGLMAFLDDEQKKLDQ